MYITVYMYITPVPHTPTLMQGVVARLVMMSFVMTVTCGLRCHGEGHGHGHGAGHTVRARLNLRVRV